MVNLLADNFACFRDEAKFEGKTVRFLKRAQIFVADLWAAFGGESYGEFNDIDKITMFAGEFQQGGPEAIYTDGNPRLPCASDATHSRLYFLQSAA